MARFYLLFFYFPLCQIPPKCSDLSSTFHLKPILSFCILNGRWHFAAGKVSFCFVFFVFLFSPSMKATTALLLTLCLIGHALAGTRTSSIHDKPNGKINVTKPFDSCGVCFAFLYFSYFLPLPFFFTLFNPWFTLFTGCIVYFFANGLNLGKLPQW